MKFFNKSIETFFVLLICLYFFGCSKPSKNVNDADYMPPCYEQHQNPSK